MIRNLITDTKDLANEFFEASFNGIIQQLRIMYKSSIEALYFSILRKLYYSDATYRIIYIEKLFPEALSMLQEKCNKIDVLGLLGDSERRRETYFFKEILGFIACFPLLEEKLLYDRQQLICNIIKGVNYYINDSKITKLSLGLLINLSYSPILTDFLCQ